MSNEKGVMPPYDVTMPQVSPAPPPLNGRLRSVYREEVVVYKQVAGQPPKPLPPRPVVIREDQTQVAGYINDDGSIERTEFGKTQWKRDMRNVIIAIIIGLVYIACVATAARSEVIGHWFSPNGGAGKALLDYTNGAHKEIYWQAYNFTSQPMTDALIKAHNRGVHVVVILDYTASRQKSSKAAQLARAGVTVYLDTKHAIAHDKTRIFDGKVVLLGSYNDSASAESRNGETLIAFNDKDDVEACVANFKKHLLHSTYLETQVVETERAK